MASLKTFVYDGDGGRVKKIVGSTTTRYISKLYECDNTSCSRFLFAGSQRIAAIADNGAVHYFHTDHLGSSSVVTDGTGAKVQAVTYFPYGATRTNTSSATPTVDVPYKYTGKELDSSTGLYYYEARYYDPSLGRFISADTLVPNPRDPQDFNRYTYAGNNPLIYTDPTGHFKIGKFFKGVTHGISKNPFTRALGWAVCAMCMQYVDHATQRYAIAGTAAMGAAYVGGFAASAFFQPFVVGAAGPMMPSMGVLAAGYGIGGAAGGIAGGGIGAGGSLLAGHQADLGRAILAGAAGGALSGLAGLNGDPFTHIAGRGLAGGATTALKSGRFELGVAFAGGAALAGEVYSSLTPGFPGINPGPGGEAVAKRPDGPAAEWGANNIARAVSPGQELAWDSEGALFSTIANLIPFVNAMAGFHDNLTSDAYLGLNNLSNFPTMLPSYGLTVAGSVDQIWLGGGPYSLSVPLLTQFGLR